MTPPPPALPPPPQIPLQVTPGELELADALALATGERSGPVRITIPAGTHSVPPIRFDGQTSAAELWIVGDSIETELELSGPMTQMPGSPKVHLVGMKILGEIDVQGSKLEMVGCVIASGDRRGAGRALRALGETESAAADMNARAVRVSGGELVIVDSLLQNQPAGALLVTGGVLNVRNSTLRANRAERGAALLMTGGRASLVSTLMEDNEARVEGGAIHVDGGELELGHETLLRRNRAPAEMGASLSFVAGAVQYHLPAPIGRWTFVAVPGNLLSHVAPPTIIDADYPFACSPGVVGGTLDPLHQAGPQCERPCPGGYMCPSATVVPRPCRAGTFCPTGSPAGVTCPEGTFGDEERLQSDEQCLSCPPGHWCTGGNKIPCGEDTYIAAGTSTPSTISVCRPCPGGAVSPPASAGLVACQCAIGTYDERSATELLQAQELGVRCRPCPVPGSVCDAPGTTLELLPLQQGYWRVSPLSLDLRACPDEQAEHNSSCAGGSGLPCKPGTMGPYCTLCANVTSQYFDEGSSECVSCGERKTHPGVGVASVLMMFVLLAALYILVRRKCPKTVKKIETRVMRLIVRLSLRARFKILVTFMVIAINVGPVYRVSLPDDVRRLLDVFALLGFDISIFGPLACLNVDSFRTELTVCLAGPIIAIVLTMIVCVFRRTFQLLIYHCRRLFRRSKNNGRHALRRSATASSLVWNNAVPQGDISRQAEAQNDVESTAPPTRIDEAIRRGWLDALPFMLIISFLLSPVAYNRAFRSFVCDKFPLEAGGEAVQSFLVADYRVECNSDEHKAIQLVAWWNIGIYAIGLPLGYACLLKTALKSIVEEEPTPLTRALDFLYREYRPTRTTVFWELAEVAKKETLAGFLVLLNPGRLSQLLTGVVAALFFLLLQAQVQPFRNDADNFLGLVFGVGLVGLLVLCILLKVEIITDQLGDSLSASVAEMLQFDAVAISGGMLGALLAGVILSGLIFVFDVLDSGRRLARERAKQIQAELSRGRMTQPPQCKWSLEPGMAYASFLSHYKVEAGSDARYLSDFMRRMSGAPSYLDSNNLVDLRALFTEGVHKSEVVVLLATKLVLTRPWCILELWETHQRKIPLILFPVTGKGWTDEWAIEYINDIETQLEGYTPGALGAVKDHLLEQGVTDIGALKTALLEVLGLAEGMNPVPRLEWQPWGLLAR